MEEKTHPIRSIAAPGLKAGGQLADNLRREVARLLDRHNNIGFPGAQPVSFRRRHLEELRQKDYYVCEKSDGIRYLLYMTEDDHGNESHYLIDRKNDYWWIQQRNLHFPRKDDPQAFYTKTLLDGELVMDDAIDEQGRKYKEPRFLIFDVLTLDDKPFMNRSLDKRLGYIKDSIMEPYTALFEQFPQELPMQAFKVEMKAMQVAYGIEMMFREVVPALKHGNDGLIFTCRNSEYRHGTDPQILKWKPASENSIDFRLNLQFPLVELDDEYRRQGVTAPFPDYDNVPYAQLFVHHGGPRGAHNFDPADTHGPHRYFADLYLAEDEWETLKSLGDPLIGRIVECVLDEQRRWRLVRFRDDKEEANHISTVKSVMESIEDSVSEQELLDAAKSIKDNWKLRMQRR